MTNSIRIQNLAKSYGKQQVLHSVSLEIPAGQTFALLGRNGAGKTTLIRTMLGLIPADAGEVQIAGINPAVDPLAVRSQVGYLAEDQTMYGWMTPLELCRFLAPFYPTWDMQLAMRFLEQFQIAPRAKIGTLSKGQSVKLGLAVALAHQPKIVILDDPAMGLDPIARKEFNRDLVEHLQSSGATILYSSHLLEEVEAVADAVAILDNGQIVRTGLTEDLREEVKQILISWPALSQISRPAGLLDVRRQGNRVSLVVDRAEDFLLRLSQGGIEYEVNDLCLDEIFEAFVIGRTAEWPEKSAHPEVVSV